MVRDSGVEPSMLMPHITDSPYLRSEPSMLMLHIVDGSILQDRTFHVNAPYHGWLNIQARTLLEKATNRGRSYRQQGTIHAEMRFHGQLTYT